MTNNSAVFLPTNSTNSFSDHASTSVSFLSFHLGEEFYGIDITNVEEIRGWEPPTLLPMTCDFILGVINLRGMIVPVMDLSVRFSLGVHDYTATPLVLIVSKQDKKGKRVMGIVVDAVSDVIDLNNRKILPAVGHSAVVPFISGLLNHESEVMTLLDVNVLLNIDTMITEVEC